MPRSRMLGSSGLLVQVLVGTSYAGLALAQLHLAADLDSRGSGPAPAQRSDRSMTNPLGKRVASSNFARLKITSVRIAPVKSAPHRSAFVKLAPVRLAFRKLVFLQRPGFW